MSTVLKKLFSIFISKEKKFVNSLFEELKNKNYVNLRKISSKFSIKQRYNLVSNYLSEGKLQGVLLPDRLLFLSISKEELSTVKTNLKNKGRIEIIDLKEIWKVKKEIIVGFLNHFEKGFEGKNTFYTLDFVRNTLLSTLSNIEEYDLRVTSEKLGIDLEFLLPVVQEMISANELAGVIKDQALFLSFESFEAIISDYIEEKIDSLSELKFEEIAVDLGILQSDIEKFLMHLVEKQPGNFVVYPLEKRIKFKK